MLEAWLRGIFFASFCGGLAYPSSRKIDRRKQPCVSRRRQARDLVWGGSM